MRIGFFGGAFDPPHLGHINTARQAVKGLCLDKLIVAPTAVSPHKRNSGVLPQMRLDMAHLAFGNIPECEISAIEIERGGVSYTAGTLEMLANVYPEDELFLIMGTDMFMSFHTWHLPEKIAKYATLAVFNRVEADINALSAQAKRLEEEFNARTVFVENEIIEISSTQIREGDFSQLLPSVKEYVLANNLYLVTRIEAYITKNISQKRAGHIFGVRDTAVHLANRYGADAKKAELAALLHDCTKEWDNARHKEYAEKFGEKLRDIYPGDYKLFHAVTGAVFAREHFGIKDSETLNAIRYHTTGRANMTMLEKIVFIADVIEPNRTFPEVEMLKEMAERDIDAACQWYCNFELSRLLANNAVPAEDTIAAHNYFAARRGSVENPE